ncbi:D-tagatose-1,6-bisphosphate aldolase subunit GatZ/KbaZ [Clostridium cavendishii DSM 21758]|uniref:D-tagatose-1,6-bisphosphate aldolase subunit GatZ/KbaZ n=1 Tax=Clostridium cavendishii DSM 21758 TaxID=1121302 RepID=A0A1M6H3A9_9CLOT|nr:class II D-tagatose-bisphosphate aldolase, non-catalytic subunit [Clostridium cavendishii]SHJ16596.1 D-tagatose-1,6-bisphosphate aldolase subunit GatZ/KbaZ [Clostridium cavendishii DSM 21758]
MQRNYLLDIVEAQNNGIHKGIYSACSANEYVIEAAMERAKNTNEYVLIEATANQVNQYGGYTGMKPIDFKNFVYDIADKINFDKDKIILGGDHLGPLTWSKETEKEAMAKSHELVKEYVMAGFTKIHLDTSMYLADDDRSKKLATEVIARRGAELCKTAEESFKALKERNSMAVAPVYIVGSEVPIPGGIQDEEEGIQVTKPEDFLETVKVYKAEFKDKGIDEVWNRVIGVVVQPGVEFGDESVHEYNREKAEKLVNSLRGVKGIVFEGHSTDYQTKTKLKEMVEDGIAILKVGPALTYGLREALFALNHIENEIFKYRADIKLSNFINVLETSMVEEPTHWKQHYHGDAEDIKYAMRYSYSDRCRYYMPTEAVNKAMNILIENLESVEIPLTIIDQYMPMQYKKIREGLIQNKPKELIKDRIGDYIDDYLYALR